MKGIVYFPPNWSHAQPDVNIPLLMPYLRDFDIIVCDLNIQYRIYQRGRENLDRCLERIKASVSEESAVKYDMVYRFLVENKVRVEYILHETEHFTNIEEYILASLYEKELQFFHKAAYEKNIDINLCNNITDVLQLVKNKNENYYLDFYERYFSDHDPHEIDIVLIFPAGGKQLISSFTLCRYIKENYPHIKIVVGGNPLTAIFGNINQNWTILFEKIFDYIMVYEGEYAVPDLLRCLVNQEDINSVPNCIHMQNGRIIKNSIDTRVVDIENGPLPDFSGYNLSCYNVPEIVLPYSVTRGCYWKKCTFYGHDFGYADCFRIKSIEKIINDLCIYKEKYHAEYIHFVDEAIPPKAMEKICHAMIERKLELKWLTCIKASKQYTEELCDLMKKAGAVFVSIGTEFGSQKMLNDMDKEIDTENMEITLTNMKKAHIFTSAGTGNFTSYFFSTCIFEREHLAFWISEKSGFLNDTYMKKEYLNKIVYNKELLLKKVVNEKLFLYSLLTGKFYALPKQFEEIIEFFDGDLETLDCYLQMQKYSDIESVIHFLLDELYVLN